MIQEAREILRLPHFGYSFTQTYPDPEINTQLRSIYEYWLNEFSEFLEFPFFFCDDVSEDVARKTGLKLAGGFFKTELTPWPLRNLWKHTWCEDSEGRIVDLTARQFNLGLWLPHHFPKGVVVIEPDHPMRQRYEYY